MFSFTGNNRSYSFPLFHADIIPNSLSAIPCPNVDCEWVIFKNNPDSPGNCVIGSDRVSVVGSGVVLAPGASTVWIPAENLNLFWHIEYNSLTRLNYANNTTDQNE